MTVKYRERKNDERKENAGSPPETVSDADQVS